MGQPPLIRWKHVAPRGEAFHAIRDTKTRRNPVPPHRHDFAEVFWIDQGRARHRVNGDEQSLEPGCVVFMRPSDTHAVEPPAGEVLHFTNIAFSLESWGALGKRYFEKRPSAFWSRAALPEMRRVEPSRLDGLNRQADTLAQSPRERLYIERFLLDLLAEFAAESQEAATREGGRFPEDMPDWLLRACREIARPEQLAEGAGRFTRLAGRSREHVARSMRHYLGISPTRFINRARMRHAARQLEMSNRGIVEIAGECGLENLGHFYALFRDEFGMTPRDWRQAHRRVP